MEIILTGATGYVGSTVLRFCTLDPAISKIFVLTRRPLPEDLLQGLPNGKDKVSVIIKTNWLNYSEELQHTLRNARACIWCIGGRHTQVTQWPTAEEYLEMSVDYPTAAARAFATMASRCDNRLVNKFRFVFCSGHASEMAHHKDLWIMGPTRRAKGCAERNLQIIARENEAAFESITVRPCGIYPQRETLLSWTLTRLVLPYTMRVEELAIAMTELCKGGRAGVVSHQEAESMGRNLLKTAGD